MFNDLFEEAESYLQSSLLARNSLDRISNLLDKLDAELDKAYRSMDTLESPEYAERVAREARTIMLDSAPDAFAETIYEAVRDAKEFNFSVLIDRLMDIAYMPNAIQITTTGSGWSTYVDVKLDLNRVAGTLSDWARGVVAAREALLGARPRKYDPIRASAYWKEKVYESRDSNSSYRKTIDLRLAYAGTPAPYWQLLDQGTTPLDSDRGGIAWPVTKPTKFVDKTKRYLVNVFNKTLEYSHRDAERAISELRSQIRTGLQYWREINELYNRMTGDAGFDYVPPDGSPPQGGGVGGGDGQDHVMDYSFMSDVDAALGHYEGTVDYFKVADIIRKLNNNLPVPVTAEGRIEITAPGSKTRVRPRLEVLLRLAGR